MPFVGPKYLVSLCPLTFHTLCNTSKTGFYCTFMSLDIKRGRRDCELNINPLWLCLFGLHLISIIMSFNNVEAHSYYAKRAESFVLDLPKYWCSWCFLTELLFNSKTYVNGSNLKPVNVSQFLSPLSIISQSRKAHASEKKMFSSAKLNLSLNASIITSSNVIMESTESFQPAEFVVLKFLLGLFSFVGFAENAAVIMVVLTSYVLRDIPSNWFVLSLAIGDALFCVYASVIFIHFQPRKHLPNILKSLWYIQPLGLLSYLSSSSSLLVLIFNRFLSIYNSLKYPSRMTLERAKRLIFVVWIVAVLLAILYERWTSVRLLSVIYFTLTSLSTIALNVYLLKKAIEQRRAIKRQHAAVITGQKKSIMSEYRSFFRLTVVTFTFAVASIYTTLFSIYRFNGPPRGSVSYQRMVVAGPMLSAMNSAFDPLVYFITSHEFKKIFNKIKVGVLGRVNQHNLGQRRRNNPTFVIRQCYIAPTVNH